MEAFAQGRPALSLMHISLPLVRVLAVFVCLGARLGAQASRASHNETFRLTSVLGLDEYLPTPEKNPLSIDGILLGERLFFDSLLSRTRTLACASCHRPEFAFADTARQSRGVDHRTGRRNAPALINRGYGSSFSWDGRAASLEAQVLQPIRDTLEMGLSLDRLLARLESDSGYRRSFVRAFSDGITPINVSRALASYVRTIRSGDSPFDRYRAGDTAALSPAARRGLALFDGKANCSSCHVGANFTDEQFHNTGVAVDPADVGRYMVTHREVDRGAFKTPTLREIARTAPFMHDGSLATLEAVVDFYDRGGRPSKFLDREIHPLRISDDEKRDLVAFLGVLGGRLSVGASDYRGMRAR